LLFIVSVPFAELIGCLFLNIKQGIKENCRMHDLFFLVHSTIFHYFTILSNEMKIDIVKGEKQELKIQLPFTSRAAAIEGNFIGPLKDSIFYTFTVRSKYERYT